MKRLYYKRTIRSIFICFTLFSFALMAQTKKANKTSNPIKKIAGGLVSDARFTVSNISYYRTFDPKGKGDLLHTTFDINNLTDDTLNLKVYVMAFHEENKVDRIHRMRVSYPDWRKRDFEKEVHVINVFDSIPEIDKKAIDSKLGRYEFPDFLSYINYVEANPASGKDIFLLGAQMSDPDEINKNDKKQGSVREKMKYRKEFNVFSERLKTTIICRLMSKYGAKENFFSHLGILIIDPAKKKGSKVVFRKFIKFNKKLKIF